MSAVHTIVYCARCDARTQATVEGYYSDPVPGHDDYGTVHGLGSCAVCRSAVLLSRSFSPDDWQGPEAQEDWKQVYPRRKRRMYASYDMPERVRTSLDEALKCESADAWLATAVMVRRTLEAIGREFDPKVKAPQQALESLHKLGVLSDELVQWGDHLRFLGNIGAHPTDQVVTGEDAGDAVEFLLAIIEIIYHLRQKFKQSRERVTAVKGAAKPVTLEVPPPVALSNPAEG